MLNNYTKILKGKLQKLRINYDLFIFDVNGVLDNQWECKRMSLSSLFPPNSDSLVDQALVGIDRNYEMNHSLSFKDCLALTLTEMNITPLRIELLQSTIDYYEQNNGFNKDVVVMALEVLKGKKICFYSSLSSSTLEQYFIKANLTSDGIQIYSRDDLPQIKPSINNIQYICQLSQILPKRTVVIGDNIACDLMPAFLLGAKTLLVTPFVNELISSQ